MATITKTTDKRGNVVFQVRVSNGRGRRVCRSWRPEPQWSAKTVEAKLTRFACQLERDFADGKIQSAAERRQEALERAQLKNVQEYAEQVFLPLKARTASVNTIRLYATLLEQHVFPSWGGLKLGDITPAMVSALLLDIAGRRSHATVASTLAALRALFACAVEDGTLAASPVEKVKAPAKRKDDEPEKVKYLDEAALRRIFDELEQAPTMWRSLILLMADIGARRGEICALQWQDINFDNLTVSISKNAVQQPGAKVSIGRTKTGASRVVDFGEGTAALLHQWREEQQAGKVANLEGWIFTKPGTPEQPLDPVSVTRYFSQLGKRCGVSNLHPHQLRHTVITNEILSGVDVKTAAVRAGHRTTAVTLGVYSHTTAESCRRAGQAARGALEAALRKKQA